MAQIIGFAVACLLAALGLSLVLYTRKGIKWWGEDHLWLRRINVNLAQFFKISSVEQIPKLPTSSAFFVSVEWYLRISGALLTAASVYVLYVIVSGWLAK